MTKDLNGAWLALGVAGAVAAMGATMGHGGSGNQGPEISGHVFDVEGNKIPAISHQELLKLPNGTFVEGMMPIGIKAYAVLRNGRLRVTSHKVPGDFDDFSPNTVKVGGVTYGII
jgi:hypothetical protein